MKSCGLAQAHVSKDELDDLLIMDAWLKRHHDEVVEVAVDLGALDQTAFELRSALMPPAA